MRKTARAPLRDRENSPKPKGLVVFVPFVYTRIGVPESTYV